MFKRLFFKSFLMLAIFIGAGAYVGYIKGVDVTDVAGKLFRFANLGNLGDLNVETLRIDSKTVEDNAQVLQAGKQRVYKWQDQSGQWHYTQIRPPAHARAVESIDVDPQTNVIAGYRSPEDQPAPVPEEVIDKAEEAATEVSEMENPYSPDTIKKLFEDAKQLQEKLGKRYEVQEQLLQGRK